MRSRIARRLMALALVLGLALPGCSLTEEESKAPPPRPPEKADKPAELPPGWRMELSRVAGFTIGVPPGWNVRASGTSTVLTSPDKQVAISVSADRTDEALTIPLKRFALGTAESLSGFADLEVGKATPYKAQYPAVRVNANGKLKKSGVRQGLALVILRRDAVATYPVLAATGRSSPFVEQINPIVRTLRGRPVAA